MGWTGGVGGGMMGKRKRSTLNGDTCLHGDQRLFNSKNKRRGCLMEKIITKLSRGYTYNGFTLNIGLLGVNFVRSPR